MQQLRLDTPSANRLILNSIGIPPPSSSSSSYSPSSQSPSSPVHDGFYHSHFRPIHLPPTAIPWTPHLTQASQQPASTSYAPPTSPQDVHHCLTNLNGMQSSSLPSSLPPPYPLPLPLRRRRRKRRRRKRRKRTATDV